MSDVKELLQRSIRLREAGRLDEAYDCALSATSLEPDNANAWWQLALVARAQKDDIEERDALAMVTDLAPGFSEGWCSFANLEMRQKDYDAALTLFREALQQDGEHIRSLRGLMLCMEQNFVQLHENGEYMQVLQKLVNLDSATPAEVFKLAYLLGKRGDHLASAHLYESMEDLKEDSACLQNLGLMYQRLSRWADSADVLRLSLRLKPDNTSVEKALGIVSERRRELREALRASRAALVPQEDWYRHYVSPFELLDISPQEAAASTKAVMKAKQAVLRELELEENTVAWLPGLHIDRSSVLSLLEELNDPDSFAAHEYVVLHPELLSFLSKGELKHFLFDPPDVEDVKPKALYSQDLLRIISSKFAAQFDDVLTRAIEKNNPESVEVLLSGRRLVLPEHNEICFEGATRALLRLLEPLDGFCERAQTEAFKPEAVFGWLQSAPLAKLLPKLTLDFIEIHENFYRAMRGLSIAHYNKTQDAETALALLSRAQISAEMASGLQHQFQEDKRTLEEHVAELKKFDVALTFGEKSLSMTRQAVVFGSQMLQCEEIESLRWGIERTTPNPSTWRLQAAFGGGAGKEIVISWNASESNFEKQKELWGLIVQAAVNYYLDGALSKFKHKLKYGLKIPVGGVLVADAGVEFEIKGLIFTRRHFSPWSNLHAEIQNGAVVLQDRTERKAAVELPMGTTYNAVLLHMLCALKEK